jgi:hypothetical protein
MAAPGVVHLANWDNFYVIVGSSAGALIGLQFVVMTLIAEDKRATNKSISAFGTPTVIHFSATLLISAMMSAPWESIAGLRAALGIFGILGMAYAVRATLHAIQQNDYQPVFEDWMFYSVLPLACYLLIFVAAFLLLGNAPTALFLVAIVAMGLLFIGIHNSWDTVTYLVLVKK